MKSNSHGSAVQKVRDHGMLESALGRPVNKWKYEQADLATCAAAYGFGLTRNHAFVDGKKRAAFVSLVLFLRLNGIVFKPDQAQALVIVQDLLARARQRRTVSHAGSGTTGQRRKLAAALTAERVP